jgi:hypothetical protein
MPPAGAPPAAEGPPTPGALLAKAPPWPREWAQRLGHEALRRGARVEVFRHRADPGRYALRWVVGRRTAILLEPGEAGVLAELRVPEGRIRAALEALRPGDPFAPLLQQAPHRGGYYRLRTWLDGPRSLQSLVDLLGVVLGP